MTTDSRHPEGVIFDMDGVLVDSNPFHLQKWVDFLRERQIDFNLAELPRLVLGQRNDTAFRHFFGPRLTKAEMSRLSQELEARFRKAFQPHARPMPGLMAVLDECRRRGVPMAVASSAMRKNVEFVLDVLKLRSYFRLFISGDDVGRPKPDPEIYLNAAARLKVQPEGCLAFEDSPVGVESAKRAGMKCVAIASTFSVEELCRQTAADLVVPGFEAVSLEGLRAFFVS